MIEGNIFNVNKISSYNLVSLSNIFDWSEDKSVKEHVEYLSQLKKGSVFGEISLLGNQTRTTGASTASSPVIVMEIDKKT